MKCLQNIRLLLLIVLLAYINSEIVGVMEIMRHGSRSPPFFSQSGDKYYFDASKMMLTINGFNQHKLLGKWLRERYVDNLKLLPEKFDKNDFQLYTTATQRTIFSLNGHMAGFYPEADLLLAYPEIKEMKFNQPPPIRRFTLKNTNKQNKIAVNVKNRNEIVLHSWKCKLGGKYLLNYGKEQQLYKFSSSKLEYMLDVFREKLPFIFNRRNQRILYRLLKNKVNLVKKLAGYVTCSQFIVGYNFFNFSKNFMHLMRIFIVNKWYNYRLNPDNSDFIRLAISGFFDNLKNYLINKSKGDELKKFVIFSGHDTNIVDILSNLIDHKYLHKLAKLVIKNDDEAAFNFLVPNFASDILFELHKEKSDYYVKIFYNNLEIRNHFISHELKYTESIGIPLNDFIEFLNKRIDTQYKNLKC